MNKVLKEHYEATLAKHGPNHRGMDWPNEKDAEKRYEVMLKVRGDNVGPVLDIGCGIGLLANYMFGRYFGIDISPAMIEAAKKLTTRPKEWFEVRDILENPFLDDSFDYCIMNGVLTVKATNTQEQMWDFAREMILAAYKTARIGITFNIMSKQVDWERNDLFHVGFDEMASFLEKEVSRHFVIRADYGLYEYSVYVYKNAQ